MTDTVLKSPGELIREEMQSRGWSQKVLAEILGVNYSGLSQVLLGKRGLTLELAVALGAAFENGTEYWTSADTTYKLSQMQTDLHSIRSRARLYEAAPVKEMEKRGWIIPTKNHDDLRSELLRFYGDDPEVPLRFEAVARRSDPEGSFNPSHVAWLTRARQLAKLLPAARYSDEKFEKGLVKLRTLVYRPDYLEQVSKGLAQMGIRFVVVEHLPNTKIDGAAFWLDENAPVIAMSLRYDRIDNFWFTLAHELSHIRHRDEARVDANLVGEDAEPNETDIEARANLEAAEYLLSKDKIESFILRVKPFYKKERIIQFSNLHKVHPGIVIGQLQARSEVGYHQYREFLVKVRAIVTARALTDGWGQIINTI